MINTEEESIEKHRERNAKRNKKRRDRQKVVITAVRDAIAGLLPTRSPRLIWPKTELPVGNISAEEVKAIVQKVIQRKYIAGEGRLTNPHQPSTSKL